MCITFRLLLFREPFQGGRGPRVYNQKCQVGLLEDSVDANLPEGELASS